MKTRINLVLTIICIVVIFFFGWLAFQTIGFGAMVVIALILGTGIVSGLFSILGAHLSERSTRSSSDSNRKFQSTQEALDVAIDFGEKEATRRREAS